MEYVPTGQGPAGGITAVVAEAVTAWGANIIRLPLSQDFWFGCTNSKVGGAPVNGAAYQALVQSIINYCSSQNTYVILDLHWSGTQTGATPPCGTGWGDATQQEYMPDDNSVTFWDSVAGTAGIQNNPAVLFDLYNEPFDYSSDGWSIWRNGGTEASYGYHTPGMQALLNTVRTAGANNVVVVGGLDYAYDLTGLAYGLCGGPCNLNDTANGHGVIYSSHIYPQKGSDPWVTSDGDAKVSVAAANYPVIIGEFGEVGSIPCSIPGCPPGITPTPDPNGTWDQTLLQWMNGNNGASY
ncbi:MAG TPA: cellulase family glycosylhydrolase, partial [bacterium]|nr:cellulase family glycosylhydrolase [bacterium]